MLKVTTKAEKMEGHLAGFTISSLYIQENYPNHFFWNSHVLNPEKLYFESIFPLKFYLENSGKTDVKVLVSQM